MVCGSSPESADLTLSCGGKDGGVIQSVQFVSFGTATGTCGAYSYSKCNAASSRTIVEKYCLGKATFTVPSNDDLFGDPCFGTVKKLVVQVNCSVAAHSFKLQTEIPVNSEALVHVSKLDLSNVVVTEGKFTVWKNGQFYPVSGIKSAADINGEVIFSVGSGDYSFVLSGTSGTTVCAFGNENNQISLSCPNNTVISVVNFASFGTPTGSCSSLAYGTCHAGSSNHIVEQFCLHKNTCVIDASDSFFGDPCFGTIKTLSVRATCS